MRIKRIAGARTSFDLQERLINIVGKYDGKLLETFLPHHLFIEEILLQIIKRNIKYPSHLNDIRLNFHETLQIAKGLVGNDVEEWIWISCKKANEIRNNIAHRLDIQQVNPKIDEFVDLLWPHMQETGFTDSKEKYSDQVQRLEATMFFLIQVLLTIVGPDPYLTPGDILYESWKVDGKVNPTKVSRATLVGNYESISEANWDMILELNEDGGATARFIDRMDVFREPLITSVNGTWKATGALIHLSYNEIIDVFCYSEEISLKELHKEGGKPGLSQVQPFHEKSFIRGITLWKSPHDWLHFH